MSDKKSIDIGIDRRGSLRQLVTDTLLLSFFSFKMKLLLETNAKIKPVESFLATKWIEASSLWRQSSIKSEVFHLKSSSNCSQVSRSCWQSNVKPLIMFFTGFLYKGKTQNLSSAFVSFYRNCVWFIVCLLDFLRLIYHPHGFHLFIFQLLIWSRISFWISSKSFDD